MNVLASRLAPAAFVAMLAASGAVAAQPDQGRMTGRVTDGSGGALPGVTVTITSSGLPRPVSVVSDSVGQYQTPPLPPDTYAVTFEMSGFETRTNPAVVLRPGEVFVLDRELGLASLTETVTVLGAAPAPPPAAPVEPPLPLRTRPDPVPVPKVLLASVCGPAQPGDQDTAVGHIVAHRDDPRRELYGKGDVLLLDVGSDMGMAAGQNYVARRKFRIGDKSAPLKQATYGEHTAGLIQIVDATAETAVAVVVYTCGELMAGDSLEPFDALPVLSAQASGAPQFDDPARIVFGEMGQVTGSARQLMVIDRGSGQEVGRGQHITIFRRSLGDKGPVVRIGDGVVVVARPQSATIRIDRSNDVVEVGDLVAIHR